MIKSSRIQELVRKYHENKFSHAFLFVTNDINQCNSDIKNLIKQISCEQQYNDNCEKCNICYQIDHKVIPNIIEIYPDGQLIKKNQILELKESFKTKPLYIKNNIYIINNAEKLNASSANTMLKFLEEPEDNIIGFFITNNKETMLDTIKSRCQIINVNYEVDNIAQIIGIDEEKVNQYKLIMLDYLKSLITDKKNGLLLNKELILANLENRNEIALFFKYMYYVIDRIVSHTTIDQEYEFLSNLELQKLITIQKKIYNALESINFNVNIELLLDNFVLEMEALI